MSKVMSWGWERWGWQQHGSVITLPPVSLSFLLFFFVSSTFSNLQQVSPPAVFWSSSTPAFWLPPTSCPEARIYLSICMQEHMLACAHTSLPFSFIYAPPPPFLSYIRTHIAQLPLYACFKEITEASKKRERIYLCASAPIIQYLHYAFRETNPCHAGNALRALDIKGCIGKTGIHYKAYIYFTLI